MILTQNINGRTYKLCDLPEYHYLFNMDTGFTMRWGKTKEEDPSYSPIGPEIIDLEVSTICHQGCTHCYKSNSHIGKNMSFDTFRQIFCKLPKNVSQIAFGIGSIDGNPELFKMFEHCRANGVVPNLTINGSRMNHEYYDQLAILCGAVAVSLYDYDTCYNAVNELTDRSMTQVNIHCLLSEQTYDKCMKVLHDKQTDPRLAKLNAIVFLWLKPKGERNTLTQISSLEKYKKLVDYAMTNNIAIGMDSCSASNFLKAIKDNKNYNSIKECVEPCESTLFSYYINVDGLGFPCSFSEGFDGITGINILECNDFLKDVWFNGKSKGFRDNLLCNIDCNLCRMCPIYDLTFKR